MDAIRTIRRRITEAILPGICLLLIAYFGHHAVQGELGLISYLQLNQKIITLEQDATLVAEQRAELEHRVALLSPNNGVDPDLLDEQARFMLGYSHRDELVIFLPHTR